MCVLQLASYTGATRQLTLLRVQISTELVERFCCPNTTRAPFTTDLSSTITTSISPTTLTGRIYADCATYWWRWKFFAHFSNGVRVGRVRLVGSVALVLGLVGLGLGRMRYQSTLQISLLYFPAHRWHCQMFGQKCQPNWWMLVTAVEIWWVDEWAREAAVDCSGGHVTHGDRSLIMLNIVFLCIYLYFSFCVCLIDD